MKALLISILFFFSLHPVWSQQTYFGVDLSYLNEMEDCGEVFTENNIPKDVYEIFADHSSNLIRLRLWHTPAWQDNINRGNRYSDYADVKKSMQRAKAAGMDVLLDFHLSDIWTDPGHQVVPAAWSAVVNNLNVLQDSLYNYVYKTLTDLEAEGLLPAMVQIGNETNKGILLSQAVNDAGWSLDWSRNAALFNRAIEAVRDVESNANKSIKVMLHIADPKHADWYTSNFISNGVTDFEVVGISYYHQFHGENSIPQVGGIVADLIQDHGKEVMIVEAGYPWTASWDDNANNIISMSHPNYAPLSPMQQERWLTDLSAAVINNGGSGVIYWEPAWVSSSCSTQWAQGSHYENATFFDFQNNVHADGGIKWLDKASTLSVSPAERLNFEVTWEEAGTITITRSANYLQEEIRFQVYTINGQSIMGKELAPGQMKGTWQVPFVTNGIYGMRIMNNKNHVESLKMAFFR